jgi:hypothetical protein
MLHKIWFDFLNSLGDKAAEIPAFWFQLYEHHCFVGYVDIVLCAFVTH